MRLLIPSRTILFAAALALLAPSGAGAADWPSQVDRYYRAGFTADKLPAAVRASVARADDRALPFKELTYRQDAVVRLAGGNELAIATSVTVVPQAGSLVAIVGKDESTEAYASVQFELGYRGLLVLRDQKYFPNAPIASKVYRKLPPDHSPIMEIESLSFDPDPPTFDAGSRMTFDFAAAPADAPSHTEKMRRVCQVGDASPASTIADGLSGQARLVACDLLDDAGKSRDLHQEKVYLDDYGVALLRKVVTARFTADYAISDVHVER